MNFLTKTFTSLLAAALTSAPVMATPSYYQDHVTLMESIESVGVRVYVNSAHCDGAKFYGFYRPVGSGMMVICQQNRVTGETDMVPWTEEDLDTLRHESHHLVQDCKAGVRGDKILRPIFSDENELYNFVSVLGRERIASIIKSYSSRGATREVVLLELEAFAVAESIQASAIAEAVTFNCGR